MLVLFLCLFASFITGFIVSTKSMIKEKEFKINSICAVLNVVFLIVIFVCAK